MKLPRINCIHFDWGSGGKCNKLPKRMGYFRRGCPEIYNNNSPTCKFYEKHRSFSLTYPPVPPPCREYTCYGSNMVRTKKSKQASYEWQCKLNNKDGLNEFWI